MPFLAAPHQPLAQPGDEACPHQHEETMRGRRLPDRREKSARLIIPSQMLHGVQQPHQAGTAQPRASAGQNDEQPALCRESAAIFDEVGLRRGVWQVVRVRLVIRPA